MKNKLPLVASFVYLAWSLYHFICDVVPYYQYSSFDTMSFNLWINFIFYHSCLALAIYLLVCVLKALNCQKSITVWLFINTVLFSFIENNTFSLKFYTSHTSPLASFLSYAVWFLIHYAFFVLLFFIFTKGRIKDKLYKISILILSAGFLASFLIVIINPQHILLSLSRTYQIKFALIDALIWALYIAAILLTNSKKKIIFWCANIFTVIYSLYLASFNIISDIQLFVSVPKNAYVQSIFEIIGGSYVFDRYLLQTVCCIIVLVITIHSFKAKNKL